MNTEPNAHDGGCTCGHVRYRMTSKPMFVHCCHCTWCQRETGTAFAVNALIEADRVQLLQGKVEGIDTPTVSGEGQKISRCPNCQVAVWSNYSIPGGIANAVRFIRVGTLDDPGKVPPDIHIFTSTKQSWLELPREAQVALEYYDRKILWPQDSLDRRQALLDAV